MEEDSGKKRIRKKDGVERGHKDNEEKAGNDRHRKQFGKRQKV